MCIYIYIYIYIYISAPMAFAPCARRDLSPDFGAWHISGMHAHALAVLSSWVVLCAGLSNTV